MSIYYQDDNVTLYHGDCLEMNTWLDADVLVTDPPYGIDWQSGSYGYWRGNTKTIKGDTSPVLRDAALARWGARPALVFGSWKINRPNRVCNRLIWHKAANTAGKRALPWFSADEEIYQLGTGFVGAPEQNVLVTHDQRWGAYGEVARFGHPTPKPTGLLERLIRKCPPGIIADPFAGSGSTLVAARNLGRKAIGVEIEERYCEIIAKRLDQMAFDFDATGDFIAQTMFTRGGTAAYEPLNFEESDDHAV